MAGAPLRHAGTAAPVLRRAAAARGASAGARGRGGAGLGRCSSPRRARPRRVPPVAPRWTPPFFGDTRAAWEGAFPDRPDIPCASRPPATGAGPPGSRSWRPGRGRSGCSRSPWPTASARPGARRHAGDPAARRARVAGAPQPGAGPGRPRGRLPRSPSRSRASVWSAGRSGAHHVADLAGEIDAPLPRGRRRRARGA